MLNKMKSRLSADKAGFAGKSIEVNMKKLYIVFVILSCLFYTTNIFAQAASVTWPLTSNQNPNTPTGNIQASPETIGAGSGTYLLSIVPSLYNPYGSYGQRLWTGNQGTGWIAGLPDYTRYIQFDANPTSGNNFTIQNVSFQYSDFPTPTNTDFHLLKGEVWYSTDNWNSKIQLNSNPLDYLSSTIQTFSANVNVLVQNGQPPFSLRIYPYAPNGAIAMTPSFATHRNVIIEGTTSPVVNTGSICGMKFNDLNGNGRKDEGELGLSGWTITLSMGAVQMTATTGADGSYCFNNLSAGTYTVAETNQNGWLQTAPSTGTYSFALESGQNLKDINFGNKVDATVQVGSICGIKFNDLNGDGRQDLNEPGLPNWTITLTGAAEMKVITDERGNYCFTNLKPGKYTVSEVYQNGWLQTAPSTGTYSFELTSGQNLKDINFGNKVDATVQVGSICGIKFNDLNGDGKQDLNEPGLPNWTITLTGSVEMKVITDERGNYCFTNLKPGKYTVSEVYQNGWLQTAPPTGTYSFALESGQNLKDINFGNKVDATIQVGSICGIKFNDLNGNGRMDSGEPGLPNWTITLTGSVEMKVITDERGNYCFTNLKPGKYTVAEVYQNGWLQTSPSTGTYSFALESGQNLKDIDFGNKVDVTVQVGSICGIKFNDLNGNGRMDSGEPGLPNWTITLTGSAEMKIITDERGNYCFTNLKPGKYTVSEVYQNGWLQTAPSTGTYSFELTSGQNLKDINFGNKVDATIQVGSICGIKFNDLNGDGRQDLNEPGLPNWTITLTGSAEMKIITDERGNYCFTNLKPGKYTVSEVYQNGWLQTAPSTGTYSFELTSGQNLKDINFGNKVDATVQVGSICGIKFNDLNGNGRMDSGEPGLPNWTINLTGSATLSVTTDASGSYCFTNLSAGTYNIAEVNQSGWQQTTPASPGTYTITLASGQNIGNQNFGNKLNPCTKAWSPLGNGISNGGILALAVIGSDIYAGGVFSNAGGVSANNIAKWDGTNWSPLDLGVNGDIYALAVIGTDLYVGGNFTIAGSAAANYIAKWNGANWSVLGTGMNGSVGALAVIGTDVYAGGDFTTAGGVSANRIAKWDGFSWTALGSGIVSNNSISAIAVIGTDLYAGGNFTTVGGVSANYIAKWDGVSLSWSALGTGMNSSVDALAVIGTSLYAGGSFSSQIAKWDGTSWSALGSGMNGQVRDLAVMGGELYAGGAFSNAGGVTVNYIAKWNGTNWSAIGSGTNSHVIALAASGSDLYAGGTFTTAGGVSANRIAKYSCDVPVSVEDDRTDNVPQRFLLEQNYPNPFNPSTVINYQLSVTSNVKITVYDPLGREVATLVNENKSAGYYKVNFDAKELTSGIYFYTIRTGNFIQSKKMILMK